ncbi:unnamed protein product [Echinostoma caproni]|uniref:Nucleolar protein 4 helical domain-containing protein n=1 Tax=Echinostoma caproni TaxID=27848 RepID=A0A183AH11_9TREM|nr:unnamed protein product [Echinostoma caproni]
MCARTFCAFSRLPTCRLALGPRPHMSIRPGIEHHTWGLSRFKIPSSFGESAHAYRCPLSEFASHTQEDRASSHTNTVRSTDLINPYITFPPATSHMEENESNSSSALDGSEEQFKSVRTKVNNGDVAFGVFIRKLTQELLDYRLPITQQSHPRLMQIEEACRREFPQFTSRQIRLKIRAQLKLHRRTVKKAKDSNPFGSGYKPLSNKPRPILPWGAPPDCPPVTEIVSTPYDRDFVQNTPAAAGATAASVTQLQSSLLDQQRNYQGLPEQRKSNQQNNSIVQHSFDGQNNAPVTDGELAKIPEVVPFMTYLPEFANKIGSTTTPNETNGANDSVVPPAVNFGLFTPFGWNALTNFNNLCRNVELSSGPEETKPDQSISTPIPSLGFPFTSGESQSSTNELDFGVLLQLISQFSTNLKGNSSNDCVNNLVNQTSSDCTEPNDNLPPTPNPASNLLATSLRISASLIMQSAQLFEFVGLAAAAARTLMSTNNSEPAVTIASPNPMDRSAANSNSPDI